MTSPAFNAELQGLIRDDAVLNETALGEHQDHFDIVSGDCIALDMIHQMVTAMAEVVMVSAC